MCVVMVEVKVMVFATSLSVLLVLPKLTDSLDVLGVSEYMNWLLTLNFRDPVIKRRSIVHGTR